MFLMNIFSCNSLPYFKFLLIDNERIIVGVQTQQILRGLQGIRGVFELAKNHPAYLKRFASHVKRDYLGRFTVYTRTE